MPKKDFEIAANASILPSTKPGNQEIHVKKFIDTESGELYEVPICINNLDGNVDKDFEKIWLTEFITTLDFIGNKKMKVFNAILEYKDSKGNILATIEELAVKSGTHFNTVYETIRQLKACDFLIKRGSHYMINPAIMVKGSHNKRMMLAKEYQLNKPVEDADPELKMWALNEKLKSLKKAMAICYNEIEELNKTKNSKQSQESTTNQ